MPDQQEENSQPSAEEVADHERLVGIALDAAREALRRLGIPMDSPDESRIGDRWRAYYKEVENDIHITIQLDRLTPQGVVNFSLGQFVLGMLRDIESAFSDDHVLERFEIKEGEKSDLIFERLVGFSRSYISYLPIVLYHSFHQAAMESIVNHIRKELEPDLRDDPELSETGKTFDLFPNKVFEDLEKLAPNTELGFLEYLQITDREFSEYRGTIWNDRKVFLTPERYAQLPAEYEELRKRYWEIKRQYKHDRDAFSTFNRGNTEDWDKHWNKIMAEDFPFSTFTPLDLERTPSELAAGRLESRLLRGNDTRSQSDAYSRGGYISRPARRGPRRPRNRPNGRCWCE